MIVLAAVRLMAGGAALLERGLMVVRLLCLIGDIAVTAEANIDRIGFRKSWLAAGVRTVAVGAVSRRTGMRNFRRVDQLGFIVVAGHAQRLGIGLRQHDFSIFRRSVADFALLVGKRRMRELRHQLGCGRLVRIMAAHAVGRLKWLVLMRFLQVCTLYIVAIDAKRRRRLGEVIVELRLAHLARLVRRVARFAAHVEGGMPAALLRNVDADLVATQTKIFFLIPRGWLQQLILIVRGVRIMALHAVAHRRGMNRTFYIGSIFVGVASQTESMRSGRNQLYASDILRGADLVATGAPHGDRGMHRLSLSLIFMAGKAGGGISLRIKRDRMRRRGHTAGKDEDQDETCQRIKRATGCRIRLT